MTDTPAQLLLRELASQGAYVRVVDGQLLVKPPRGGLTEPQRSRIRAIVGELIVLLTTHPCTSCGRFAFQTSGVVCFQCRKTDAEGEAAA
jgi:hypothetical protein